MSDDVALMLDPSDRKGDKARDRVFEAFARTLYQAGVRPNHLTLAQVPIYVVMVLAGLQGRVVEFGLWQLVIMGLDGMDGTLARRMGVASRSGAVLDAVFDLMGVVVVVAVALHLYPAYADWLWVLLVANLALYAQNGLLDEKAVSYVRGPLVVGMALEVRFVGILWFGILVPLVVALAIFVVRLFVARIDEAAYRPGFRMRKE